MKHQKNKHPQYQQKSQKNQNPNTKKYVEKNNPNKQSNTTFIEEPPKKSYRQKQINQDNYIESENRSGLQLKEAKYKNKVSRLSSHTIDYSQIVDEEQAGIKVEARSVKKFFLQKFFDATKEQLKIRKATYTPCIFFQYCNESRRFQYVDFKDVIKCNKERFLDNPELVSVLFQQLYDKVAPKYFKIAIFGIKIAKQKHIYMTNTSVFRQKNIQTQLIFHYCLTKQKKQVNFVLIDKHLNFIYFKTGDIYKIRQDFPEEFDLYEQFEKHILQQKNKPSQDRWDILQNQEIAFNENDIKYIGQSIEHLQKKFELQKQNTQKQLSELEDQIKQKLVHLSNMNKQDNSQNKSNFQRLQNEINNKQFKIRQIRKVIRQIALQKQNLSYKNTLNQWFFIKSIKKLILLQKQICSRLPILQRKNQIIRMLRTCANKPIIIEGQTGSGKSTQLPQILIQFYQILDDPFSKPILVTQPRRLATRTLAERIAFQLGEQRPNNFVDFKNSMEKQVNSNAKIILKLDRLVLDQIAQDRLLEKYSCLIIDEAHERTISIDVLIGLIRNILNQRSDFRVIITSASMDVQLFQRQFQTTALKVSGRLYDVAVQYKDYQVESTISKIQKVLDQEVLLDENSLKQHFKGHILVFCSSVDQINKLTEIYTKKLNSNRFLIYPLHGKIAPQQQRKVFLSCKQHKIIFASRIAQTAITIDDVRVVIDPGIDIQLVYDQRYKFSSMKLRPISQSSAKQRAGRAGRTAPGYCFRLYSQKQFQQRALGKVPQMENSSLDTVVLRLKSLGINNNNVIDFPYISKPDRQGLLSSIQNLKIIGGLDGDQLITQIGRLLITIPIQPMLSRSIVQALLFDYYLSTTGCKIQQSYVQSTDNSSRSTITDSIIEILCMVVSSSSLFHINESNQNEGQLKKFEQFNVTEGDFFFLRSIYRQFKQNFKLVGDKAQLSFWFKQFYLNRKTLKQVKQLQTQIRKVISTMLQLKKMKFQELNEVLDEIKQKFRHCKSEKDVIISCLITSFIPNLCVYSQDPQIGYTLISQQRPIAIYGTSTLSLVGLSKNSPKWILSYDFYTSEKGKFYCKISQGIDFSFMKNVSSQYAWNKFQLGKAQNINPFYQNVWQSSLTTKVYTYLKALYIRFNCGVGFQAEERHLYQKSIWIFNDEENFLKIFILKSKKQKLDFSLKQKYGVYFEMVKKKFINQDYYYSYFGNSQVKFSGQFTIKLIQKVVRKDLLISEYCQEDYPKLKSFVKEKFSQIANVDVFPFSRNIKIQIKQQTILKKIEQEIEWFLSQNVFSKRPIVKIIPKNERKISQAKVLLIFFVENSHIKYKNNSQKYYNMLKDFHQQEENHLQLSNKTDLQWKEEICILLERVQVNSQNCAINIWGNFDSEYKTQKFVQLCAEVSSFQGGIYQKLKQFQGRRRYLGCDKLFIKLSFEQIVGFPNHKIFTALKQQYLQIVISQQTKFKDLKFTQKLVRIKNINYTKIVAKSSKRQILMKAAERIHALFQPKLISLKQQQRKFLIEIDRNNILDKLQLQYNFGIAFDLNRFNGDLFVFCHSLNFDDIVSKLKKSLKSNKYATNAISYKGKNLKEVIQIIKNYQALIVSTKQKLDFQINFRRKEVSITSLPQHFYEIKKQIEKLSKSTAQECQICMDKIQSSFILINCTHSFCRTCILDFIKIELNLHSQAIKCPQKDCSRMINVFDIQLILGETMFQRYADNKIKKYVQQETDLIICPKCSVILDTDASDEQINCEICGYKKCLKCGQTHKNVQNECKN